MQQESGLRRRLLKCTSTTQVCKRGAAGAGGAGFPAFGGVPGMGGAGAMSSLIANQIAEARGAFLTGRSFGWGAGGANAKSKELETAEQSRDFLRRIETNTRTGGVIVGA